MAGEVSSRAADQHIEPAVCDGQQQRLWPQARGAVAELAVHAHEW